MRDRWSKEPGSPRGNRMSSLAPSSSMPPIRKGQLVWNSEKGFVRESELRSCKLVYPRAGLSPGGGQKLTI